MLRRGVSSVLARLCDIVGHALDRERVKHTGHDFVGPCRRCGTPLYRDRNRHWVPMTDETIADLDRLYGRSAER